MVSQPNLPIEIPKALISLPAEKLLAEFGAGKPTPGSGSAAALMGLLAAQLIVTVCKISHSELDENPRLAFVLSNLEQRSIPILKELFQKDSEIFEQVIATRLMRDKETDPTVSRRLRERALRQLREATELIATITRLCIQLVDYALLAFDVGSKKVRGDSGAAISAAVAGAMSGVFIINLNLRSFQASDWARRSRTDCDALYAEILRKQEDAFARIVTLRPDDVDTGQFTFL